MLLAARIAEDGAHVTVDPTHPGGAVRAAPELGVTVDELEHIYDVYMSPGSVTECLHLYAAPYTLAARTSAGGGAGGEGEDIEILELPYDRALTMITDGQIADGKTIMLLYWAAVHGPFAAGVGPRPPLQT